MTTSSHREPDNPDIDTADIDKADIDIAAIDAAAIDTDVAGDPELETIFEEFVDRSASILELDVGQRRAWVSGMLSAWRSDVIVDDPDQTDREFVAFVAQRGPATIGREATDALAAAVDAIVDPHPESHLSITRSWFITDRRSPDELTAVISLGRPDSTYAIVGAIVDGALVDLQVSGDVVELLGGDPAELTSKRPALASAEVDQDRAIEAIVEAWGVLARDPNKRDLAESFMANQQMVRADLVALGVSVDSLPLFRSAEERTPVTFFAGLNDSEIAEGNRWALEALTVALRPYEEVLDADAKLDDSWQEPTRFDEIAVAFRGPLDVLSRREQDALVYLEWADWVGAIVGIVSATESLRFDGETLVDRINAQPELTSAIEESDRDYVAYGFDVALALWADAGLVEAGTIVAGGRAGLVQAAKMAWSTADD